MRNFFNPAHKTRLYWLCQILGWSGIVVQQMLALQAAGALHGRLWAFPLLIWPFGIGITHLYRWVFKRLRLDETSVFTLLWSGGVAVLVLSCLLFLSHHHLGHWLSGTPEDYSWLHIAVNLAFWAPILFGWVAVYHLDKILYRLHQAEVQGLTVNNALKESQLQQLRNQINPHFLFNSLNSIRALTFSDPHRAGEAVGQLADLLRAALSTPDSGLHTLRAELTFVEDYLQLEKMRFDERLHWRTDVEEDLLTQQVPALLLLTLVENAVKHGIGALPEGGRIEIQAKRTTAGWRLTVFNSGTLQQSPTSTGLGLDNARQRLRHFFGDQASLQLSNAEGGVLAEVLVQGS